MRLARSRSPWRARRGTAGLASTASAQQLRQWRNSCAGGGLVADADDARSAGRRRFLDLALTASATSVGAASLYPAIRVLEPVPRGGEVAKVVGKVEELRDGRVVTTSLGERPVIVLRAANNELRAFAAVCPHLGCTVSHDAERGGFSCACHGGRFSETGQPVAGPPTRPLEQLRADIVDDMVVVSKK